MKWWQNLIVTAVSGAISYFTTKKEKKESLPPEVELWCHYNNHLLKNMEQSLTQIKDQIKNKDFVDVEYDFQQLIKLQNEMNELRDKLNEVKKDSQ